MLHEAEQRLAQSGGSLSAFVNAAVLHQLQIARGRDLLAADEAEPGAIPENVKDSGRCRVADLTLDAGALVAYEHGDERPMKTEREGFEPSNEVSPVTRFPVAPVQPLRHLSRCMYAELSSAAVPPRLRHRRPFRC